MMSVGGAIMDYDVARDEAEAFKMIEEAVKSAAPGKVHLDTADVYGVECASEKFIKACVEKHGRDAFFIASKFSLLDGPPNGKPEYVKQCCKNSLERMGIQTMDLFYMHRMDCSTPIEETCKAFNELIGEGLIKYVGLSEAPPHVLRRAVKVAPISCVQQEWSLLMRDLEADLVPCCRELGIGIVVYSPLARGLLTGAFKSKSDFPSDWRMGGEAAGAAGYLADGNIEANLELSAKLCALAAEKGCTPSQLALSWVLSKGDDVVVIPGSKSSKRMLENFGASAVLSKLAAEDLAACEAAVDQALVRGARYTGGLINLCFDKIAES